MIASFNKINSYGLLPVLVALLFQSTMVQAQSTPEKSTDISGERANHLFEQVGYLSPGFAAVSACDPQAECHAEEQESICHQCGLGRQLEENGIYFNGSITQFYQGITQGGEEQLFRYGGHGEYGLGFDFGKLTEWEGLELKLLAEHRFAKSVNEETGSIIPVALSLNLPEPETDHVALTQVLFEQEISESLELFFGKINTLEFDTNAFADGNGRIRFFSTSFNYNPIATRTIPFSTLGAGFNILNDGERIFTFAVLNSEDTPTTSGFDVLFEEGASLLAELIIPVRIWGRRGNHRFAGSWSSRKYTSLHQNGRVDIPRIPIQTKDGSWSLLWNADQILVENPCDSERGWGLFGRAGLSDGNPNPIEWFLSFGLGGQSMLPRRENDTFGAGWYYTGISDEFGPVVSKLLGDGQGVELYYNIAFTEWFYVTPDLQFVKPNLVDLDTAVVPGLRARIEF